MSFQSTGLRFLALPRGGGQNLKRSRPGTKPKKLVCAFPQNLGGGDHTILRLSLLAIDSLRVAPGLTIKEGPVSGGKNRDRTLLVRQINPTIAHQIRDLHKFAPTRYKLDATGTSDLRNSFPTGLRTRQGLPVKRTSSKLEPIFFRCSSICL